MNEFQYFQTRTMIEQNAFHKIVPVILATTVLVLIGTIISIAALMAPSLPENFIPHQKTDSLILFGLLFYGLAVVTHFLFGGPVRTEKKERLQDLIEAQKWAKDNNEVPTLRSKKSMEEFYYSG
jgi:hypothetical protein